MAFSKNLRQHLWAVRRISNSLVCHPDTFTKSTHQTSHQYAVHHTLPLLHKRMYSKEGDEPANTINPSASGESRGDRPSRAGHLDYDLDKLLRKISEARESNEQAFEAAETADSRSSAMDIEELVEFLKEEKGEEVCVIRIPPEREYVRYFVTCEGMGGRHIQKMADNLAAKHKRVEDESGQRLRVGVEGRESDEWAVVSLGDTVVHLMTEECRQLYQLEQLWTLGHHYDDQYRKMEKVNLESDALK